MNRFVTALLVALCAVLLAGATANDVQSDPRVGRQQSLRNRQLGGVSNPNRLIGRDSPLLYSINSQRAYFCIFTFNVVPTRYRACPPSAPALPALRDPRAERDPRDPRAQRAGRAPRAVIIVKRVIVVPLQRVLGVFKPKVAPAPAPIHVLVMGVTRRARAPRAPRDPAPKAPRAPIAPAPAPAALFKQ